MTNQLCVTDLNARFDAKVVIAIVLVVLAIYEGLSPSPEGEGWDRGAFKSKIKSTPI